MWALSLRKKVHKLSGRIESSAVQSVVAASPGKQVRLHKIRKVARQKKKLVPKLPGFSPPCLTVWWTCAAQNFSRARSHARIMGNCAISNELSSRRHSILYGKRKKKLRPLETLTSTYRICIWYALESRVHTKTRATNTTTSSWARQVCCGAHCVCIVYATPANATQSKVVSDVKYCFEYSERANSNNWIWVHNAYESWDVIFCLILGPGNMKNILCALCVVAVEYNLPFFVRCNRYFTGTTQRASRRNVVSNERSTLSRARTSERLRMCNQCTELVLCTNFSHLFSNNHGNTGDGRERQQGKMDARALWLPLGAHVGNYFWWISHQLWLGAQYLLGSWYGSTQHFQREK